jgi:hypothetical protein
MVAVYLTGSKIRFMPTDKIDNLCPGLRTGKTRGLEKRDRIFGNPPDLPLNFRTPQIKVAGSFYAAAVLINRSTITKWY